MNAADETRKYERYREEAIKKMPIKSIIILVVLSGK